MVSFLKTRNFVRLIIRLAQFLAQKSIKLLNDTYGETYLLGPVPI